MNAVKLMKVSLIVLAATTSPGCEKEASFKRDVHPILEKRCLSCHSLGGEGYAASGFSVENYKNVMKGTKYGPVVIPGSSLNSTLVRLIKHQADPSIAMPRSHEKGKLSEWLPPQQIRIIETWINQGAKDN